MDKSSGNRTLMLEQLKLEQPEVAAQVELLWDELGDEKMLLHAPSVEVSKRGLTTIRISATLPKRDERTGAAE